MKFVVKPSRRLQGELMPPPSKSQTLRAILFAAMAKGKSTIFNYLHSPDTEAMIAAARLLGAKVDVFHQRLEIVGIDGAVDGAEDVINAGNSGIVLRFIGGIAALSKKPIVITGDASIRHQRPMGPLLDALNQLGVDARSARGDGYAPVIIQGPIKNSKARVLGQDSQFVSSLLIAGCFSPGPIEIAVENPGEIPWVSLTLSWLERFGFSYEHHAFQRYRTFGNCRLEGFEYTVSADASSAAFPLAAALIANSQVHLSPIDFSDMQGDLKVFDVFKQMGGDLIFDREKKQLSSGFNSSLKGIEVDINPFIDAVAVLAVVGCFAKGETLLKNAQIARTKECDRLDCLTKELGKMGADISQTEDSLVIRQSSLKGAQLCSYGDHRMAMALTLAALFAKGTSEIENVGCIAKTYRSFQKDFQKLGASIELQL